MKQSFTKKHFIFLRNNFLVITMLSSVIICNDLKYFDMQEFLLKENYFIHWLLNLNMKCKSLIKFDETKWKSENFRNLGNILKNQWNIRILELNLRWPRHFEKWIISSPQVKKLKSINCQQNKKVSFNYPICQVLHNPIHTGDGSPNNPW